MSDIQELLIVDTATIRSLSLLGDDGVAALLLDDRKIVILEAVYKEIEALGNNASTRVAFAEVFGSLTSGVNTHNGKVIVPDYEIGNFVAGVTTQHADNNIRAYGNAIADPNSSAYQELIS